MVLCALDIIEEREIVPYFNRVCGVDTMHAYLTAILFKIFDTDVKTIRMTAAIVGSLTSPQRKRT